MKTFEDKFMDIQIGMVSLCSEYVKGQAEKIYIYGIADSMYSFNVFYNIHGNIVHKHQVNDYFSQSDKLVDTGLQSIVLKEGTKDVQKLKKLCLEHGREHPTEMWLVYNAKANGLDSKYSYEGRYEKDKELELLPNEEFDKWFEEVKEEVENEG